MDTGDVGDDADLVSTHSVNNDTLFFSIVNALDFLEVFTCDFLGGAGKYLYEQSSFRSGSIDTASLPYGCVGVFLECLAE